MGVCPTHISGCSNIRTSVVIAHQRKSHLAAMLVQDQQLLVFWTRVTDTPERILLSTIDISGDWQNWKESEPGEVMRPEKSWEGALEPLTPSMRSVAYGMVNQLRDPAIYVEDDRIYLLYAIAGESGIAIAELIRVAN